VAALEALATPHGLFERVAPVYRDRQLAGVRERSQDLEVAAVMTTFTIASFLLEKSDCTTASERALEKAARARVAAFTADDGERSSRGEASRSAPSERRPAVSMMASHVLPSLPHSRACSR